MIQLTMEDIVAKIDRLPAPNAVALEVIQMCSNPDISVSNLVKVISTDQSLSAQILRIANSSFFNYPRTIHSIDRAIVVLGFRLLKDIALSIAFYSYFKGAKDARNFDFQELWYHSVMTALVCKALAKKYDVENEEMFYIAGLIHDIGKLVASQTMENDFHFLIEKSRQEGERLDLVEEKFLGFHHGDIGSQLIERWNLPGPLINMVKYHHDPSGFVGDSDSDRQIRTIYLANSLAHLLQIQSQSVEDLLQYDHKFTEHFNYSADEFDELLNYVRDVVEANQQFFEIHQI